MRTYEALFDWLDHDLIGDYAREILALADKHGRPPAPKGIGEDVPAPFEIARPDDLVAARSIQGAVRALYLSADYHWLPEKRKLFVTRPFAVVPEWATSADEFAVDPGWPSFQREALGGVQRFMADLASHGLIRYALVAPGSLTA